MNFFLTRAGMTIASVLLALPNPASGHEMRPAFLELREDENSAWEMTWKVPARGPDMRLALDVRLPEGCEWITLPAREYTGDAFIDRGTFTREGGIDGEEIYIEGLLSTFTDAMVQIHRADGSLQSARLEPSAPSLRVEARPDPAALPSLYFGFGLDYLRAGWDHFAIVLGLLALAGGLGRFAWGFMAFGFASMVAGYLKIERLVVLTPRWTEVMLALGLVALAAAILRCRTAPRDSNSPPSKMGSAFAAGLVLGIVHGFAFADGYFVVGVGNAGMSEALSFLVAILAGLAAIALVLAGMAYGLAKRKPAIIPFHKENGTSCFRPRIFTATAYLLGIVGVFLVLQRW